MLLSVIFCKCRKTASFGKGKLAKSRRGTKVMALNALWRSKLSRTKKVITGICTYYVVNSHYTYYENLPLHVVQQTILNVWWFLLEMHIQSYSLHVFMNLLLMSTDSDQKESRMSAWDVNGIAGKKEFKQGLPWRSAGWSRTKSLNNDGNMKFASWTLRRYVHMLLLI